MSLTLIAAAAMIGGLIVAIWKLKPERESIIAQAAEHAVKAMEGSLASVRSELAETKAEIGRITADLIGARREIERLRQHEVELLASVKTVERNLLSMEVSLRDGREEAVSQVLEMMAALRSDLGLSKEALTDRLISKDPDSGDSP